MVSYEVRIWWHKPIQRNIAKYGALAEKPEEPCASKLGSKARLKESVELVDVLLDG